MGSVVLWAKFVEEAAESFGREKESGEEVAVLGGPSSVTNILGRKFVEYDEQENTSFYFVFS